MTQPDQSPDARAGDAARPAAPLQAPPRRPPSATAGIPRLRRGLPLPLSPAQQRLWVQERLFPGQSTLHANLFVYLRGPLQIAALQQALATLEERHELLSASIGAGESELSLTVTPPHITMRRETLVDDVAAAREHARDSARQPFDLLQGPLWRVTLYELSDNEHALLLCLHHLVCDDSTIGVLLHELSTLYNAALQGAVDALPALSRQYVDLAAWQHQRLRAGALEEHWRYWEQQLAALPGTLPLPLDQPRASRQTFAGAQRSFALSPALHQRLQHYAGQQSSTPFVVLLAALYATLERYCSTSDICLGTALVDSHANADGLIGCFLNPVPLRARVDPAASFDALLRHTRQHLSEAIAHQVPFGALLDRLAPARGLTTTPLFQVMVVQRPAFANPTLLDVQAEAEALHLGSARYDLSITIDAHPDSTTAHVEYNTALFLPGTIERIGASMLTLLNAVLTAPAAPISAAAVLSPAEQQRLLHDANATAQGFPGDQPLGAQFEAQVARAPNATALLWEDEQWSYAELNRLANAITDRLLASGVQPGDRVGLYLPRSPQAVAATLAVAKTGAAWVLLDTNGAIDHQHTLLASAGLNALITDRDHRDNLDAFPETVFWADDPTLAEAATTAANPGQRVAADALLYLDYGTDPEADQIGLRVNHRVVSRMVSGLGTMRLTERRVLLQISDSASGIATIDLWGTLLNGAVLVLPPDHIGDLRLISELIQRHGVTTAHLSTRRLEQILTADPRLLEGLDELLVSGADLPPDQIMRLQQCLEAPPRLLRVFGPREHGSLTTAYEVPCPWPAEHATVPIGRPLANGTVYVLDPRMQPRPTGIVGELYIGGPGLADGYQDRRALTDARFVANPFEPGALLYRTGQRGFWNVDGALECIEPQDGLLKATADANDAERSAFPALETNGDLEGELLTLWRDTLGADVFGMGEFGVEDNFFALGGQALQAERLIDQVERRYGVQCPLAVLFEAGTVRALAAEIEAREVADTWTPLVPIATGNAAQALFLVHAPGGEVHGFWDFAQHIGNDMAVYALQPEGLLPGQKPHRELPAMAAAYLDVVRDVQPEGPYLLGGLASGGLVAFEMARQLEAAGERVAQLVIGDSLFLHGPHIDPKAVGHLPGNRALPTRNPIKLARLSRSWITRQRLKPRRRKRQALRQTRHFALYQATRQAHHHAIERYRPTPIAAPITLFRATHMGRHLLDLERYFNAPDYGWSRLTSGDVTVERLPGNHDQIFYGRNAKPFGERLGGCLRRVTASR